MNIMENSMSCSPDLPKNLIQLNPQLTFVSFNWKLARPTSTYKKKTIDKKKIVY